MGGRLCNSIMDNVFNFTMAEQLSQLFSDQPNNTTNVQGSNEKMRIPTVLLLPILRSPKTLHFVEQWNFDIIT